MPVTKRASVAQPMTSRRQNKLHSAALSLLLENTTDAFNIIIVIIIISVTNLMDTR